MPWRELVWVVVARGRVIATAVHRTLVRCEPYARRAAAFVMEELSGIDQSWSRQCITRHVAAAATVAVVVALVEGAAGPAAPVVELVGGLALAGVAASAVLALVNRHRGTVPGRRVVIAAAAERMRSRHPQLLASHALAGLCGSLAVREATYLLARPALASCAQAAVQGLARTPLQCVPGVGATLHVLAACRSVVASATFVRDAELAAASLCTELATAV